MQFQFISYLIPLFISAFITFILAAYGLKYKTVKGAIPFAISMLIGTLWAVSNGLEMAGVNLEAKIFWANVQYFSYAFAPITWIIMVFEFTGKEDWVNKKNILIMSIIPVITLVLVWTNSFHHLIRANISLDTSGAFSVIDKDYGPWFWVHSTYSYLINIINLYLLLQASWRRNTIYKKQVSSLLIGFFILFLSSFLYVMGLSPVQRFDISPLLFSFSGLIMGWGIFHYRLFDLVPIARTRVIEEMGTGIIVLDKKNRIIDINPSAKKIFNFDNKITLIGGKLSAISKELVDKISGEKEFGFVQTEFNITEKEKRKFFELFISPITDYRKEQVAWTLIINDITSLKKARDKINEQKQELAILEERDRMARDLHDNLGQILSFSSVQLQAVKQQFKNGNLDLADEYLERLKDILIEAHKDIREYVYNVRGNINYKEDFLILLNNVINKFKRNTNIEITFEKEIPFIYKDNKEINILHMEEKMQLINIVREALTNVMKHAEAETVNIFVTIKEDLVKIIIEDDGIGIDNFNKITSSGLNIMNERARLVGGKLKVKTESGIGTRVIVKMPVDWGVHSEYINS